MAYNKAKAENEWLKCKIKEEAELRCLGFCEESITELRVRDWETFNSNRRYYERTTDIETYDHQSTNEVLPEISRTFRSKKRVLLRGAQLS